MFVGKQVVTDDVVVIINNIGYRLYADGLREVLFGVWSSEKRLPFGRVDWFRCN